MTDKIEADPHQSIFESFSNIICICDGNTIKYINGIGVRAFGANTADEIIGRNFADFVSGEYKEILEAGFSEIIDDISFIPLRLIGPDGQSVESEINVIPFGTRAEPSFLLEIHDITKIKRSSELGLRREALLRQIIESMTEAVLSIDAEGHIISANPAALAMFGCENDDIVKHHIDDLIVRRGRMEVLSKDSPYQNLARAIGFGSVNQGIGRRRDGLEFPIEFSISETTLGSREIITYIIKDITIFAEREVEKLRLATMVFDVSGEAMMVANANREILVVNPAFSEITDYSAGDVIGYPPDMLYADHTPKAFFEGIWESVAREGHWRGETCFRRKSGGDYAVWLSLAALREGGEAKHFVAVFRDLTDVKEKERKLQSSEARYRDLYENAPVGYCSLNPDDGAIIRINTTFLELLNYQSAAIEGRSFVGLFAKTQDGRQKAEALVAALCGGESFRDAELQIEHADGHRLWVNVSAEALRSDGATREIRMAVIDISAAQESRKQIQQMSKLASLGEMATSIAHELNQPLNIISMSAEAAIESLEEDQSSIGSVTDKLSRIVSQTDRAATIINHMRVFGRTATDEQETIDIRQAAEDAMGMVREQFRIDEIDLTFSKPEICPKVLGQRVILGQVMLNLLMNARDAINARSASSGARKERGRIDLTIGHVPRSDTVTISVSDNGVGIASKVLERIFEPFFTTKEVGHGTGLGLSVSFRIIAEMNGTITVDQIKGGARFTISLPVVNETI